MTTDSAMLQLLRAGLYDDAAPLAALPALSADDWEKIYARSKQQTVSGIICNAISMLPDEQMPPYGLLLRWVARTHKIEVAHKRMADALADLLDLFERNGIKPVLQKGHGVARYYSKPSLRVSGDIDLYFDPADRKSADRVIADAGIEMRHAPDGSSCYQWQGVEVEHHSSLIQLHSPFRRGTLSRIMADEGTITADIGARRPATVPAPLADLLLVSVHIMKHSLGVGIGLRHFCDYVRAYKALMPAIGEEKYARACRSLGIHRWTDVLHSFINTYLPDPAGPLPAVARGASSKATARLYRMVIEGGNFGLYRPQADRSPRSATYRKFGTFSAFIGHSGFSLRIAPVEAMWIIMKLIRGQVHI